MSPRRVSNLLRILALFAWCPRTGSVPIDNGVESEPQITCGPGFIGITFLLRNPFEGHVFVKNHYNETQCRNDQTGKRVASITVSFNTCGVQRSRSLNPKGVFVNTVVVITFHPRFITKVDRAYAFQCFYMESEKTVAAQVDISEITSVFQTQRVPMPVCRYEVLDGQPPNGQPIRYSIVGQQVFHRWVCETETTNTFCMNVNSCFVYDGLGDQAQLLDAAGCAIDRYLLQNLEYITDLSATREAHVFKFADRAAVYFQCQIALTIKDPGSPCSRPTCPALSASPSGGGGGGASSTTGGREPGAGTTLVFGALVSRIPFPGTEPGITGGSGTGLGGGSRETTIAAGIHGAGVSEVVGGGEQHVTTQGLRTEPGRPSLGLSSAAPTTITTFITPAIINQFRTTSNASYRAGNAGDDFQRDESSITQSQTNVSFELRNLHREQRSLDHPEGITVAANKASTGEDLGVWDVRAPSIAVFDLDDSTAMGLRGNHTPPTIYNGQSGGTDAAGYPSVSPPTTAGTSAVENANYCLTLHSFAILLAMAITPSCALALGCYMRWMQCGARKLY